MRVFLHVVASCLAASVATAGPYDGSYYDRLNGPNADYCTPTLGGGMAEIKGERIFFYETSCLLRNPVDVRGLDAKLYDAECGGEGPSSEKRIMIMRPREGDGVIVLTEYFVYDWVNCVDG